MRKLILTSIKGKTGDLIWEEDRLVVVNHDQGELEEDLMKKAITHVKHWLKTDRPNVEYLAIVPKATIGEPEEQKQDIEVYTRNGLLEFGDYLLSKERETRMKAFYNEVERGPNWATVLRQAKPEDIDHWKSTFKKG